MGQIYTLAQSRTKKTEKPGVVVVGKGSEMLDSEKLQKKGKQKTIAQSLSLKLVDAAKQKMKPYLIKQSWNTFHCLNKITYVDGKIYGKYCKNRICPICSNIRKAQEIKKYLPVLETWSNPQFVTLTVKSCSRLKLKATVNAMFKAFKDIKERQRKRESRKGDFHFMGIRSLESNFNPVKNTYNPHFHIIVPDKQTAEFLVKNWLQRVGKENAGWKSQKIVKIQDKKHHLIETIKYGFKIFTDPNMKKNNPKRNEANIYVKAQLNILDAFHNHRIFDRFGFNLPKQEETISEPQLITDFETFEFDLKKHDWINTQNDEVISDFVPDADLLQILGFQMDMEKE